MCGREPCGGLRVRGGERTFTMPSLLRGLLTRLCSLWSRNSSLDSLNEEMGTEKGLVEEVEFGDFSFVYIPQLNIMPQ